MRSGTLPAPLCVGMGEACAIAAAELGEEAARIGGLRGRLLAGIAESVADIQVNGDLEHRVAGNLNLSFVGVDAEALMMALPELALSSGSACTSTAVEPSYVLRALGLSDELANGSIRFGIGRFTTEAEIDYVVRAISEQVAGLRAKAA